MDYPGPGIFARSFFLPDPLSLSNVGDTEFGCVPFARLIYNPFRSCAYSGSPT